MTSSNCNIQLTFTKTQLMKFRVKCPNCQPPRQHPNLSTVTWTSCHELVDVVDCLVEAVQSHHPQIAGETLELTF